MKILDASSKAKIVKESYKEGATVTSLSKKYGVSTSAIHRWRRSSSSEEKIEDNEVEDKFIKVPIQKSKVIAKLKKAELVYENCRLAIDGEISSEKLFSIVDFLHNLIESPKNGL